MIKYWLVKSSIIFIYELLYVFYYPLSIICDLWSVIYDLWCLIYCLLIMNSYFLMTVIHYMICMISPHHTTPQHTTPPHTPHTPTPHHHTHTYESVLSVNCNGNLYKLGAEPHALIAHGWQQHQKNNTHTTTPERDETRRDDHCHPPLARDFATPTPLERSPERRHPPKPPDPPESPSRPPRQLSHHPPTDTPAKCTKHMK